MFLAEMEGPESQLYVPGGPEKGTASSPSVKRLDAGDSSIHVGPCPGPCRHRRCEGW